MKDIFDNFPITGNEYSALVKKFGKLCYFAAHQLKKKNSNNNLVDDFDDINQDLQLSLIRAGSYHKRQCYIKKCLKLSYRFASEIFGKDSLVFQIVQELVQLWDNRTRHGASRQKFGQFQEDILDEIVAAIVPVGMQPQKSEELVIDYDFSKYCKSIVWNEQKNRGKKITREKPIRSGMVSLSEFKYLGTN